MDEEKIKFIRAFRSEEKAKDFYKNNKQLVHDYLMLSDDEEEGTQDDR